MLKQFDFSMWQIHYRFKIKNAEEIFIVNEVDFKDKYIMETSVVKEYPCL